VLSVIFTARCIAARWASLCGVQYTGVPIEFLHVVSIKILSSDAGEGEQLIHFDSLPAWMGKHAW
jgi:hypothetical protein